MTSFYSDTFPLILIIYAAFYWKFSSAFFILTVLQQRIFWHSPFKPSYLARPIIEEYFLAFLHVCRKMGRGTNFLPMDRYHRLNMNWWIDGHGFVKDFVIDDRYYRSKGKKSLTDGSIISVVSMTNSIDRWYRYRSTDPSPIMSIYGLICL
jgi:hypothetical protein